MWVVLLAAALLFGFPGCEPQGPAIDHLAVARQMASELTQPGETADYSGADWEKVAEELQLVPQDSPDKAEANSWLKEIRDARHAKLFAVEEKDGGSVAYKVPVGSSHGTASSGGFPPPPQTIDVKAIEARVRAGGSGSYTPSYGGGSAKASSAHHSSGGPVTIYTTSWCSVCKAAKAHLRSRGVPFIEKDVEKDPAAKAEKEALAAGSGVPVIDVGGKILVGFDAAALDKML